MSSQIKPWLLLGGIFVVGIITGSALTIGWSAYFKHPPGEAQMKHHLMAGLTEQLKLTADQQAKIEPILADTGAKIQAIHHQEVGSVSQILKAADQQISALLTPEQQVEFQKIAAEREKMFSGHMHPWGPPKDGPGGFFHHDGPADQTPPPPTNAPPGP